METDLREALRHEVDRRVRKDRGIPLAGAKAPMCAAYTEQSTHCRNRALRGSRYCGHHRGRER